jgi:hypothetical protein
MDGGASGRLREHRVEVAKIFLQFAELLGGSAGCGLVDIERELRLLVAKFGFEDLSGAGNGVALVIEEGLDAEDHLDIAAAIETLAGAAFVGLELGKFTLPEAKDVGG